jgi:hypothetical protein
LARIVPDTESKAAYETNPPPDVSIRRYGTQYASAHFKIGKRVNSNRLF